MKLKSVLIVMFAVVFCSSILAGETPVAKVVKSGSQKQNDPKGKSYGYWLTAPILKVGVGNSNPSVTLRTASGDYTYTVCSKNNNQILNLATQAVAYNLYVQVYVNDDYYNCYNSNPYISALYVISANPPVPPPPPPPSPASADPENPPEN